MSTHSVMTEDVTPKQAAAWLDRNYEHNRPLSDSHVNFLAREMEIGRFTLATIHFMSVGNEVHLVNGQHTLHAIVKSGKTQTCVVIRERDCTVADLPKVFMHYDIQRKRTFADSVRAFGLAEKTGVPEHFLNHAAASIKYGFSGFGSSARATHRRVDRGGTMRFLSVADLFEIVPLWKDEIKLIASAIEGGESEVTQVIRTAKVFSVAMITAYYQPEKAFDFWRGVAIDDGLSVGDPRKTLNKYIPKTSHKNTQIVGEVVPNDIVTMAVTYCWNAFFGDRLYSRVSVRDMDRGKPIWLSGTTYSGNQSLTFWPTRNRDRVAA